MTYCQVYLTKRLVNVTSWLDTQAVPIDGSGLQANLLEQLRVPRIIANIVDERAPQPGNHQRTLLQARGKVSKRGVVISESGRQYAQQPRHYILSCAQLHGGVNPKMLEN